MTKKISKYPYRPIATSQTRRAVAAVEQCRAKLVTPTLDLGPHESAHDVHDALVRVDSLNSAIARSMIDLHRADEANDLVACGDALGELSGLHDGLASAAASAAARFAELTGELRRRIMAKLGIEAPEPPPADFDETMWMVASAPKIVATWKKVPGAKKRPVKRGGGK